MVFRFFVAHVASLEDLEGLVKRVDAFIFDCDGEPICNKVPGLESETLIVKLHV